MVMVVYLIIASIGYKNTIGMKNALAAVVIAVILDIICNIFKGRKWTMPDGAVITGLIISLILGTTSSLWSIAGTVAIAILSKHFISYKKRPVFNPAVFGLLVSVPLFHTGQSWWGAFGDFPAWTIIFLLIGGFLVTDRINKFPQVFSFLLTSFIFLVLMGHFNIGDEMDALRPPFINATLFFGFFMLTDPPTSPAKNKDQIIFGFLTALAGTIIYALFGGLTYLFIGLCIGNLYYLQKKRSTSKVVINQPAIKRTTRARY